MLDNIRKGKILEIEKYFSNNYSIHRYNVNNDKEFSSIIRINICDALNYLHRVVSIVGRCVNHRNSRVFIELREGIFQIQLYIDKKTKIYSIRKLIDNGDLLYVVGRIDYSNTNTLTVFVTDIRWLAKCLVSLPDQYFLPDSEKNLLANRTRTLMIDRSAHMKLKIRFAVIESIRSYLRSQQYIEVDTPSLQHIFGGALAEPFSTWYEDAKQNFYLRVAPELYLKRLIIAGYNRVFEIGKNFRNESRTVIHNPEFTMLEFYTAESDLEYANSMIKGIIDNAIDAALSIYKQAGESDAICALMQIKSRKWITIDLSQMKTKILRGRKETIDTIDEIANEYGIQTEEKTVGGLIEDIVVKTVVRKNYADANVQLINHDISISPLSSPHIDAADKAMRIETYINGWEISNAYQEMNDCEAQFQALEKLSKINNHPIDIDYINDLALGLTSTTGVGIGIDRLIMLLTQSRSILECITFEK